MARTAVKTKQPSPLPVAVAELIRRMTDRERLELASYLSWTELEEWKATAETLVDKPLMHAIRRGLADEAAGRLEAVDFDE